MNLTPEKQKIIAQPGNVLVTANPGTGKTLLLATKYVSLLKSGVLPEDILCLTFTSKAKREMEERIIKFIKEEKVTVDLSNLNVFTFHSYALENIDDNELVSSNLLRYAIFRYVKEHETLNYGDAYLIDTIVPKMENLIRYLKNFGIGPKDINLIKTEKYLQDHKNHSVDELSLFLGEFVKIYQYYEDVKAKSGIDYSDMLLNFLKLKQHKVYKFVLVDELQDVNGIEADIALKSGEVFFAVGDKKQAIFGFQGGSILNFKKFDKSTSFILSENFRSTNEILNYAREHFTSKTKEEEHKLELKDLKNKELKEPAEKPIVYDISKEHQAAAATTLASRLSTQSQVAIIARTNSQIMNISKELEARGLEHSTTFFAASKEAKENIITFLKGVLSKDVSLVRNAMFTPFFPISLQDAFEISKKKAYELTIEEIYTQCPEFKKMREDVRTFEDVNKLFREIIIPVSISYGEDYLLASLSVQNACKEAIKVLSEKNLENFAIYLDSSDLLANDSEAEKKIVVTTVHKSKGQEFENAIYIPSKTNDSSNFQDSVVKAILKSKGINAEEELEEESLRVDFVGMTRAKKRLLIITDKPSQYLNAYAESGTLELNQEESMQFSEQKKKAYTLFVNKDFEKAKALLESRNTWLKAFVKAHFENLGHISFSRLKGKAYDYLIESLLQAQEGSRELNIGTDIHEIAEKILKNEKYTFEPKLKPYVENTLSLITEIKQKYPLIEATEGKFNVPLSKVVATSDSIGFKGQIDAVFKNNDGEYLIVDWKTSSSDDKSADYRQQLSVYRKVYAAMKDIPEDKIKVAIGYVGLKNRINDGTIGKELDMKQPVASAFGTMTKKIEKFLGWRHNVDTFFQDIVKEENNDVIWRSVVEELGNERWMEGIKW